MSHAFVFAAGQALALVPVPPNTAPQIACPTCAFGMIFSPHTGVLECLACGLFLSMTPEESARLSNFLGFHIGLTQCEPVPPLAREIPRVLPDVGVLSASSPGITLSRGYRLPWLIRILYVGYLNLQISYTRICCDLRVCYLRRRAKRERKMFKRVPFQPER